MKTLEQLIKEYEFKSHLELINIINDLKIIVFESKLKQLEDDYTMGKMSIIEYCKQLSQLTEVK